MRAYLAPLAVAVAERTGAPWATLDLDDDDEHLLREQGREGEAEAYGRLLSAFGEAFAWVSLASPDEAAAVESRHGLSAVVVPNAVSTRHGTVARDERTSDPLTLLFVSNLTYQPNVDAAESLVREVLPGVRERVSRGVVAELVGRYEPGGRVEKLAGLEGVRLAGYVDDLRASYERADVVVAPLRHGAGTRIKVLEALSYGVPVVTTRAGAAGLGAEAGVHLLVAETPEESAAAVAGIASDQRLARSLVHNGRALVEQHFDRAVVARRLLELMPVDL